jgi:hypothetical protein
MAADFLGGGQRVAFAKAEARLTGGAVRPPFRHRGAGDGETKPVRLLLDGRQEILERPELGLNLP